MVEASKALIAKKNIKIFEKHSVLTKAELEARYEIMLESYMKNINIEALTMLDMSKKDILPAVIKYITDLAASINTVNATGVKVDVSVQSGILKDVSAAAAEFSKKISELESTLEKGSSMHDVSYKKAYFFRYEIFIKMCELRVLGDKLESMVGSAYWPMPTYGDLLFKV
jgi:glutamine synthetase